MNGINLALDTNAIIAILNGNEIAIELVNNNHLYVSFVAELEAQSFQKLSSIDLKNVRSFLNECIIVDINSEIKKKTIDFRTKYSLKLPDAIIAATSFYLDMPLISGDKVFSKIEEISLVHFSI